MKNIFILLLFFSQICIAQSVLPKVSSFTLVNGRTGAPIKILTDGSVINLNADGRSLNILATTSGSMRGVEFVLTGAQAHLSTDDRMPYAAFGDSSGKYNEWMPTVGNYILSAAPILTGDTGTPLKIAFSIVDGPLPSNQSPAANAGTDLKITLPTNAVTLTGTGTDPDGTIAKYQWIKLSGPAQFSIVSPTQAQTTINGLVQGVYTFQLGVTDNRGATATDVIQVTVNAPTPSTNQSPAANAGADLSVTLPTNSVTLTGTGNDPDGTIAKYQWTKLNGPAQFKIMSGSQAKTNVNNLVQGVYTFQLQVTDNSGATATDIAQVTVKAAPPPPNKVPTVNAGKDITITLPTNRVVLTGTAQDADGRISKYQWTKVSGPAQFSITSAAQARTNVNNLVQGEYSFQLQVTDNRGATATDIVKVTVNAAPPPPTPNQPPTVNAGSDITISLPTNRVTLNGTVNDPDGRIVKYQWTKLTGPSQFSIASPAQAKTNVNNMVQGVYTFALRVTDNRGAVATDVIKVTVNGAPLPQNQPPTAIAGKDLSITLPINSVTLTGTGTDPDGRIVRYQWTKLSGPTQGSITSPTQARTNISNMVQGVYVFQLQVMDNRGSVSTDIVNVTVNAAAPAPNTSPTANAGADIAITLPTNNVTLSGTGNDPDGTIASYQWTKLTGPAQFTIVSATQAQATVNGLVQGVYTFQLRVTDNLGATATDVIQVTVNAATTPTNQSPTANAGTDITITLPTNTVTLTGSGNDPDGTIASYQWTKLTGPAQFTIVSATQAQTTVNELAQGVYTFQLRVTDNLGATATDVIQVSVNGATTPTNQSPTANAGTDITIILPTNNVSLTGTGNDPDGTIASYQWTKLTGPAQFTIVSGTQAQTTVNGLAQGVYTFQLRVTDNQGATDTDVIQVTVNAATTPPANRGGYYASPNGTGNGTFASPFKIADFWKVAKPGDTLNLMDGRYTGAASMITPPQNLSGTAAQRIVIRAVNDGKVEIDGQSTNPTFELRYNNYFTIEGINVHHPGDPNNWSVSVVYLNYSSNNILRRICAWEARDGNTNIFGVHNGTNNLVEDCAGWGTARKIFSNSQQGNFTTFRRCFARWEGSHAEGPKHGFALSYNSYNALAENCVGTWDGIKMKQNYELLDYNNNGIGQFFTNYQVQQPNGIFSHDGFDVQPDIANIRIYGCIAYLKANQRHHNSTKKMATTYTYEIKGVDIKNSLAYIEPGSRTDIPIIYLDGGTTANNKASDLTLIGGGNPTLSSTYSPTNINRMTTCGTTNTGAIITKRTVNGVQTNEDLWPWPMNQRIMDAMVMGGYAPYDVTKEVFGLCGSTAPTPPSTDIVAVAKQWLAASPANRSSLEATLDSWQGNIDSVIQKVKPVPTATEKGQVFYQSFSNPVFQQRWPSHQFHMYVPSHYTATKPIGLMIWLHGGGSWSSGDIDHLAQYDMDNEQVTGRSYARTETDNSNYILVAPIAPFGSKIPHPQHASRWDVPDADQYLMDIITEIASRYNIDYNRVVVAGFSMGGIGAYHQALRLNDRLSAVMASAGSWTLGTWDGLKNMPMYLIHGVTDAYYSGSGCRPHNTAIEYARLAHTALYRASTIHRLYEYPGGHSWDGSGELYWKNFISGQTGWVTDKVRNPYRTNVTAVNPWRSYEIGNNFGVSWAEKPSPHTMWISIKQIGSGTIPYDYAKESGTGGCSSSSDFNNWSLTLTTMNMQGGKAEANITGPNQIVVTSTNVTKMSLWLHPNMVNFSNPVNVTLNGTTKSYTLKPSLLTALKSYERRWDWGMIYHAEIDIN